MGLLCVEALWLNPAELSVLHRPFIPSQPYWLGPGPEQYSSCLPTHPICHKSLPPGVFGVPHLGKLFSQGCCRTSCSLQLVPTLPIHGK